MESDSGRASAGGALQPRDAHFGKQRTPTSTSPVAGSSRLGEAQRGPELSPAQVHAFVLGAVQVAELACVAAAVLSCLRGVSGRSGRSYSSPSTRPTTSTAASVAASPAPARAAAAALQHALCLDTWPGLVLLAALLLRVVGAWLTTFGR